jgi:hypothetical protein
MFVEFGSLRSLAKVLALVHRKVTADRARRPHMVLIIETSVASGGRYCARRRLLRLRARAVGAVS